MPRAAPSRCKLTSLTVTKRQPAPRPYLLWDTVQRGLDQRFRSSNHIRPPCRAYRPRCERRAPD